MKKTFALVAVAGIAVAANADLINEFEPNPSGTDPSNVQVELKGTPFAAFNGFLSSIETDPGGSTGVVDRVAAVSGSYDANGLALVTIPDLENPSFTFVFSSADPGLGNDLDVGDDLLIDNPAVFGTIFDAYGSPDAASDEGYYAGQLGGTDMTFIGSEPVLTFREFTTMNWYAVDFNGDVYDEFGVLFNGAGWDLDPASNTFGSRNPAIPAPGALALLGLGGLAIRRRR